MAEVRVVDQVARKEGEKVVIRQTIENVLSLDDLNDQKARKEAQQEMLRQRLAKIQEEINSSITKLDQEKTEIDGYIEQLTDKK